MNWKIAFYVLLFIIFITGILYGGNQLIQYYISESYDQGILDGQLDLALSIQQTGSLPWFDPVATNESGNITFKAVRIVDLCKGVNQNE